MPQGNNNSDGKEYLALIIVIDTLLAIYFSGMSAYRYFTTKVYLDIFYDTSLDMVSPAVLGTIIANGLYLLILLTIVVCIWLED